MNLSHHAVFTFARERAAALRAEAGAAALSHRPNQAPRRQLERPPRTLRLGLAGERR